VLVLQDAAGRIAMEMNATGHPSSVGFSSILQKCRAVAVDIVIEVYVLRPYTGLGG